MLFLDLFERLREEGIPCTTHEWLTLMEALQSGVVQPNLASFYWTSRSLLVKRVADFDRFDAVFLEVFAGIEAGAEQVDHVLEWLKDPKNRKHLSSEEMAALEALDLEELRKLFEQRLREQKERHDGGNRWVGTGGTSPFGHGGFHPSGVRVGGSGGGRQAMQIASRRLFENYRNDRVLDIRQIQMVLRKLRQLTRVGQAHELDLDETIDRTGRNAGDLEIVMRAPRRNQVRLVLLMDAGGSMTPHAQLVSTVFSAASKSSHWKSFSAYYFHNAIYEHVYVDMEQRQKRPTSELISEATDGSVLILVGDATMHPAELTERWGAIDYWHRNETPAIDWLWRLQRAFPNAAWLNPVPKRWWSAPSCRLIQNVFPMHPLTLEGIDDAIRSVRSSGR